MSKESFSWKNLFINDSEKEDVSEPVHIPKEPVVEQRFPTNANASLPLNTPTASSNNPFLGEVLSVYEKGFESLNSEGFDFFELYKSVVAVGINNPQSYQMAFAMGKSLKPEINKQFLLDKSGFYVSEIEKVFKNYETTGNSRQQTLAKSVLKTKDNLTKEIAEIQAQIEKLKTDLQVKSTALQQIDDENKQSFLEIEQKIEANNLAKHKLLESINTVISGINQYL